MGLKFCAQESIIKIKWSRYIDEEKTRNKHLLGTSIRDSHYTRYESRKVGNADFAQIITTLI